MSRRKSRQPAQVVDAPPLAAAPPADHEAGVILANKLTVADARHLLRNEGGEMSPRELAIGIGSALVTAGLLARAIVVGQATAWQLLLPSFAQYLALLVALPIAYLVTRHPALKSEALRASWLVVMFCVLPAISAGARGYDENISWRRQLAEDSAATWKWIADSEMHWPLLSSVLSTLFDFPRRIGNLYRFGPPFMGAGIGCAARLLMPLLTCFLLPFLVAAPKVLPWYLWAMIVAADFLALWVVWSVQARLRKYDASRAARPK